MFTRIAMAGVLACLLAGCAKKSGKPTGPGNDAPPPNPQAAAREKAAGEERKQDGKANWLTDPRGEVVKDQLPVENSIGRDLGIKLPVPEAVPPPAGDPRVQAGGAKAKGILQAQPAAPPAVATMPKVGKPVTESDMKEVWIFIENASGASGKMPQPALVYSALVKAESKAAELVKDGSIFLTGAAARESIWAFEWKALTQGGLAASQNGVENLSAAELKRRLGK
jgi:hypothetical protein